MYSEDMLKWYDKMGKARPTHTPHGMTADNISDHMAELKPTSWKLEGNQLIGDTEFGPFVQTISPDVVLVGTDSDGLPIFAPIELS